jgi:hypothetical protein
MYTNIGKKIKSLAVVICIVFIVLSVLIGLVAMAYDDKLIPIALLAIIAAALISWLSSFVLYGFGELVENSAKIAAQKEPQHSIRQANTYQQNAEAYRLQKLFAQGAITEEEYHRRIGGKG